jgi:hypothetical protein
MRGCEIDGKPNLCIAIPRALAVSAPGSVK